MRFPVRRYEYRGRDSALFPSLRLMLTLGVIVVTAVACGGDSKSPAGESSITTIPTRFADVGIAEPARQVDRSCLAPSLPDPGRGDFARIAVTDPRFLDALCALGMQTHVVAVTTSPAALPYYLGPTVTSLPAIGNPPDASRAAAAKPDIVLTSDLPSSTARGDSRAFGVAPVARIDMNTDWKTEFLTIGAALNRSAAARSRLNDLMTMARSVGNAVDAVHTQVSLVRVGRDDTVIAGTSSFAGQILTVMGAQRPPSQRVSGTVPLSNKNLAEADGDIIYISYAPNKAAKNRAHSLLKSDAWLNLGASTWKRVFISDDEVWYDDPGVIAARWVITDVQRTINGAS